MKTSTFLFIISVLLVPLCFVAMFFDYATAVLGLVHIPVYLVAGYWLRDNGK